MLEASNMEDVMAKTKSVGTKVAPEFDRELQRLRESFGFNNFGEMLETLVSLLQYVDSIVLQIKRHPREWSKSDLYQYLSIRQVSLINWQKDEFAKLFRKRIRQRFGQDGLEHIEYLIKAEKES